MTSIPRSYLKGLAQRSNLTSFQTAVFVERMADINVTDEVVCKTLGLDRSRYKSRMTAVYKKFNVMLGEKTPNKSRVLFNKVLDMYVEENKNDPSAQARLIETIDQISRETQAKIFDLIDERCGHMQILNMSRPIDVNKIFTQVKITDRILSKTHMPMSDVVSKIRRTNTLASNSKQQVLLSDETDERIDVIEILESFPRVLLLGKPGAGKTTLLKYLGFLINNEQLIPGCVPAFVSLKAFQSQGKNLSLREFIEDEFVRCGVTSEDFQVLFSQSRIVFLLDGLDEILEENMFEVESKIEELVRVAIRSKFVISCRLAANRSVFENFVDAEICDFTDEQIDSFVEQWFEAINEPQCIELFLAQVRTEKSIREMATNPLLLTLLCITFSDLGDFPCNRAELYKEGVVTLLQKWDKSRRISRPQTYEGLSRHRKEDLLGKIAYKTFGVDEGLFRKSKVDSIIQEYIKNLPQFIENPNRVELDSSDILDSIIVQHGIIMEVTKGIYGFSHRTFHEYFLARVVASQADRKSRRKYLDLLIDNIYDHRWREVFVLTAELLPQADEFIMLFKQQVDSVALNSASTKNFLVWLRRKSFSLASFSDNPDLFFDVQDFYFNISLSNSVINIASKSNSILLDKKLIHCLVYAEGIIEDSIMVSNFLSNVKIKEVSRGIERRDLELCQQLELIIRAISDSKLKSLLSKAKESVSSKELPAQQWWANSGNFWHTNFRNILIGSRDIGHKWNFQSDELDIIKRYYEANKLLNLCLKGDCYVDAKTRKKISANSFLPIIY